MYLCLENRVVLGVLFSEFTRLRAKPFHYTIPSYKPRRIAVRMCIACLIIIISEMCFGAFDKMLHFDLLCHVFVYER